MALIGDNLSFLIEQIILEGILDRVKEKFAESGVDTADIDYMSKNDPSGRNKYLEWMVLQLAKDDDLDHDYVIDIVDEFHRIDKNLERKDINQYSDIRDLSLALRQHKETQGLKRAQKRHKKYVNLKPGTRLVYKDEKLIILNPTTKDSVCHYGAGTEWCITMKDRKHFEEHAGQNIIFYYVFDLTRQSKDPNYKIAYAVHRDMYNHIENIEIFDAEDNEIDAEDAFDDEELEAIIRKTIVKDAKSQDLTDEARQSYIRDRLTEELDGKIYEFNNDSEIFSAHFEDPEDIYTELYDSYVFHVDVYGDVPLTEPHYLENLSVDGERFDEIIRNMSPHVLAKHVEDAISEFLYVTNVHISEHGSDIYANFDYEDQDGSLIGQDSIDSIVRELDYIVSNSPKISQIILRIEKELIENGEIENWLGSDDLEEMDLPNVEVEKDFDSEHGNTLDVSFDLGIFPTDARYRDDDIKDAIERVAKFKYSQLKFAFSDEESLEELPEIPNIMILRHLWGMKDGEFKAIGKMSISHESWAEDLQFWSKFINDNIEDIRSVVRQIIE